MVLSLNGRPSNITACWIIKVPTRLYYLNNSSRKGSTRSLSVIVFCKRTGHDSIQFRIADKFIHLLHQQPADVLPSVGFVNNHVQDVQDIPVQGVGEIPYVLSVLPGSEDEILWKVNDFYHGDHWALRQTNTGQCAIRTTLSATEPRSALDKPVRPREPHTTRS